MINRRTLLKAGLAAVPLASTGSGAAKGDTSWSSTVRRIGQLNMTEHDPAVLDVEQWADYWASLKVDAVLVSVTGIIAFYQTKVPFHRKSKFLGDRDFFGDCCAAAKKRRMRVVARMSPDLNWKTRFRRTRNGFSGTRRAMRTNIRKTRDCSAPACSALT